GGGRVTVVVQNREADLDSITALRAKAGLGAGPFSDHLVLDLYEAGHISHGGIGGKLSLGAMAGSLYGMADADALDDAMADVVRRARRYGPEQAAAFARARARQLRASGAALQADFFDALAGAGAFLRNAQRHRADTDAFVTLFTA